MTGAGPAAEATRPSTDAERWLAQLTLAIVPSWSCNLSCLHCFAAADATPGMSAERFLSLLRAAEALRLQAVSVTGGELFAWREHRAVLPAIAASPVPVTILTNGTLADEASIEALAGSRARLCLSVDGPEHLHDRIRGAGAHARTRETARRCALHGVPFVVSSTVLRGSLPHLVATLRLAHEWGAEAVWFSPLQRLGGRSAALEGERLRDEDCVDLLAHLHLVRPDVPAELAIQVYNLGIRAVAERHPCAAQACWGGGCGSRKWWPSVVAACPDGTLRPQSLHVHPQYSAGDALRDSPERLLRSYWGSERHRHFQRLTRYVFRDLILAQPRWFYFWDELLREASARPASELPRYERVPHPHDHAAELAELRRGGVPRPAAPDRSVLDVWVP